MFITKKILGAAASRSSRNPIEMIVFFLILASFAYASLFRSLTESEYFNEEITSFNNKIDSTKVIIQPDSNGFILLNEKNDLITKASSRIQLKQIIIQSEDLIKNGNYFIDKINEFKEIIEKELENNNIKDILCLTENDNNNNNSKCFKINYNSLLENLSKLNSTTYLTLTYALKFNNNPYYMEDKISDLLHFDQFISSDKKQPIPAEKGSFVWLAFAAGHLVLKVQELIQVCKKIAFFYT
jgi:hypothetical protein